MAFLKRKFELGVVYGIEVVSSANTEVQALEKAYQQTTGDEISQEEKLKSGIYTLRKIASEKLVRGLEKSPKGKKAVEQLRGFRNNAKEIWGILSAGTEAEFIKNTFNGVVDFAGNTVEKGVNQVTNQDSALHNLKRGIQNKAKEKWEYHQATRMANDMSIRDDIEDVKSYNKSKMELEQKFPGAIDYIRELRRQKTDLSKNLSKTISKKFLFWETNKDRRQVNKNIKLNEQSLKKMMEDPEFKKLFDQFEESHIKIRQNIKYRWQDAVSFANAEPDPVKFNKTLLGQFYLMTNTPSPYPNQRPTQRQQGNTTPKQQAQTQESSNLGNNSEVPKSGEKNNSSIPDFSKSRVGDKFKLEYLDTNQPNMRAQNCEAEIEERMGVPFIRITAGRNSELYSALPKI